MMKNIKKLSVIGFLFIIIAVLAIFQPAWGADDISVTDIQPVYVEKGSTNYTVTVRAIVENNGEGDNVVLDIAAIDGEGFQLKTLKLSGYIEAGKKRALIGRIRIEKSVYEQIAQWECLR